MLFERYIPEGNLWYAVHFAMKRAQIITIGNTGNNLKHKVNRVKFELCRGSSEASGTLTASIRNIESGLPGEDDLCSGTYDIGSLPVYSSSAWIEFTFDPTTTLSIDTQYAIVLRTDAEAEGDVYCRGRDDGTYTGGQLYKQRSGQAWVVMDGEDLLFEEHGSFVFLDLPETINTADTGLNFYSPLRLSEVVTLIETITSVSNKPVYYYEPSTVSQFTLEESDVLEFSGLTQDDSTLRNDIIVIGDGVSATTSDSTSMDAYGRYAFRYEDDEITDSNDAATLASQILENYKDPKTAGSIKITGKTGIHTRSQFTLDLPNIGINSQKYEIVQYQHQIDDKGFHTVIYFGEIPWDLTREVANLLKKVY